MVCIINTTVEDNGYRMNPDSSSVIYMNGLKEAQFRIVVENSRKQDEVKQNRIQANFIKRAAFVIKWGVSYNNILSSVANLLSVTNTM